MKRTIGRARVFPQTYNLAARDANRKPPNPFGPGPGPASGHFSEFRRRPLAIPRGISILGLPLDERAKRPAPIAERCGLPAQFAGVAQG